MKKILKKHDFDNRVDTAKTRIINKLKKEDYSFKNPSWSTLIIIISKDTWKDIKHIIKDIVCTVFQCDKAGKYCRVNMINDKLYVRFKTA